MTAGLESWPAVLEKKNFQHDANVAQASLLSRIVHIILDNSSHLLLKLRQVGLTSSKSVILFVLLSDDLNGNLACMFTMYELFEVVFRTEKVH